MIINKNNIQHFIPQRFPFVMIDNLLKSDEKEFITEFEITKDNIFLQDEILSESALIENIAQTCAAGFGYLDSLKENEPNKLGFIGAISKLQVKNVARLNDIITTKVCVVNQFESIYLIEGTVYCSDKELLSCQMKIAVGVG